MTWKPIDIAPRDGTAIVVAFRSPISGDVFVALSRWSAKGGWLGEQPDGEWAVVAGQTPFAWIDLPDT